MKMRNFYALLLSIVLVTVLAVSCVKIPTEGHGLPNFTGTIRFINAASDVGETSVLFDGTSVGTLSVGQANSYTSVKAGTHAFYVPADPDTMVDSLVVDTDFSGTYYVVPKVNAADRRFLKHREHWSYANEVVADTMVHVSIVQLVPTDDLKIGVDAKTATIYGFKDIKPNVLLASESHSFYVISGDDTLATVTPTLAAGTSSTLLIYGTADAVKTEVFNNKL